MILMIVYYFVKSQSSSWAFLKRCIHHWSPVDAAHAINFLSIFLYFILSFDNIFIFKLVKVILIGFAIAYKYFFLQTIYLVSKVARNCSTYIFEIKLL